jgi:uncharacterized protein (TIGR02271 family)
VRDAAGRVLGTVDELIVDTDKQTVAQIVLADGRQFSAHDVFIGDHVLTIGQRRSATPRPPAAPPKPAPLASSMPEAPSPPTPTSAAPPAPVTAPPPRSVRPGSNGDLVIPIVDEEIDVGKRSIDAGGVRIHSHVVEKPIEQSVRLREEHITVERRPFDRALSASEADERFRDGTVEMKALSEVPIVGKRAHVVEEIIVRKEVTERVEKVRDTVRHMDAEVTELPSRQTKKP